MEQHTTTESQSTTEYHATTEYRATNVLHLEDYIIRGDSDLDHCVGCSCSRNRAEETDSLVSSSYSLSHLHAQ